MLFESMVRDGVDCNAQTHAIMLVLHTRSGLGSTTKEYRMWFHILYMQKKKLGCCKDNCSTDGIRGMYNQPQGVHVSFSSPLFSIALNCSVCQGYPLKHILQMAQLSKTEAAEVLKASTVYTSLVLSKLCFPRDDYQAL